jgi:hypothetical protein
VIVIAKVHALFYASRLDSIEEFQIQSQYFPITIISYIHPEEVPLVLTGEKYRAISLVLLYNTARIATHHVSKTILGFARFRFDSDLFHLLQKRVPINPLLGQNLDPRKSNATCQFQTFRWL